MLDDSIDEHGTRKTSGHITAIHSQKKNPRRLSVFLDEEFAFGVHQDVLLEHQLYTGRILDETDVSELVEADALIRAKETALSYLGHRARTEFEIRRKLQKKGFSDEIADKVLARLYELSYVDDAQFASDFVRDRFKLRGYGPQRLRTDLIRLGVDRQLIENALNEGFNETELLKTATMLAEKRWKRLASEPEESKRRQKIYGFLLRRGYSPDIVRAVLDQLETN